MRFCRLSLRHEGVLGICRLVVSLSRRCITFCKECRLVARQVVEGQLNYNMTFQVPLQQFTSHRRVRHHTLGVRQICSILKEHPRTIMNGAYSTIFDTNIPGVRQVLCAPLIL